MLRSSRAAAAALLACLGAACKVNARADRPVGSGDTNAAGGPAASAVGRDSTHPTRRDTLTDGDIATFIVTANSMDSAAGAYARTRAASADVRTFAARMVREHGTANRAAVTLVQRLSPPNSTPHENTDIRTLRSRAEDARADLARDSGAAFDHRYIEHAIKDHEDLLKKLDDELIPRAQDAALKQLLARQRTEVNAHLQEAKRIQDAMHG